MGILSYTSVKSTIVKIAKVFEFYKIKLVFIAFHL